MIIFPWTPCADPESFVRGGPTLTVFVLFCFVFYEGREDLNSTKRGPSSARQRNVIKMAFRWRTDDGPALNAVIFQGIWISIAKKHYIDFSEGSGPPVPPLDPRMDTVYKSSAANNCQTLIMNLSIEANSVDPEQTAPIGTV